MPPLSNTFRVAIFDQFLEGFAKIPRAQQKKVNRFLRKFREDPTASSINYESISTFADPNLRTVRIDQAYRAIVLKPSKGNIYVLLWVDHHDEAMAWAKNKRCTIHPETGSLQVLTAAPTPAPEPAPPPVLRTAPEPRPPPTTLFAKHPDADLTQLGVPDFLMPRVRALVSLTDLDNLAAQLPPEAYEGLFYLAEGEPLDDILSSLGIAPDQQVDPTDFEAALDNAASRRSFVIVDDDEVLATMLDAPLEKWRVFLHPTQRKLVEQHWNGPARVLGGAGTGKTVVAMHRAVWLVSKPEAPTTRILFTTFTRNLAADIAQNLRKICPAEHLKKIEVVPLDKWVADLLKRHGYGYTIAYYRHGSGILHTLWEQAMERRPTSESFPTSFYREEWDYIVQSEGCDDLTSYTRVRRSGRGVRMSRKQRKAIWPVFQEYRDLMEERNLRESIDAMRDAARLINAQQIPLPYDAIIVDEAQDMSTIAFKLLRAVVPERPNDLFIVGDGHQRIYRRKVVLGQAGVNIRGRGRRLKINYRTTDEIRSHAVAQLKGITIDDLDGGADSQKGYKSLFHGSKPQVQPCRGFSAEINAIAEFIKGDQANRTCLVARTNSLLDQYESALKSRDIPVHRLSRSAAEDRGAEGIRLATMHRVKGLEFDRVIIAGLNEDILPLKAMVTTSKDRAVRAEGEKRERALFYVALTRARREVLLTSFGTPSPWLLPPPERS